MTIRTSPLLALAVAACVGSAAVGQTRAPSPAWTDAQIEQFLATAEPVGRARTLKGVTAALRVTLSDGGRTHDAQVQTIDRTLPQFMTPQGMELNFRDSWKYNVAAYRIDRLIGMDMVPVSIERKWRDADAAYTWWIDDVLMEEGERAARRLEAPDPARWTEQVRLVNMFDQLIANTDRNAGNLLITRDWRLWAIDHTRAFRLNKSLQTPKNVATCRPAVMAALKALDRATLDREIGRWLTRFEIEALLARRDQIIGIVGRDAAVPPADLRR